MRATYSLTISINRNQNLLKQIRQLIDYASWIKMAVQDRVSFSRGAEAFDIRLTVISPKQVHDCV